jgi:hypothetical protein
MMKGLKIVLLKSDIYEMVDPSMGRQVINQKAVQGRLKLTDGDEEATEEALAVPEAASSNFT